MATTPLRPWQTPKSISIDELSTHYVSRHTYERLPKMFSRRSYNFVFCVPFEQDEYGKTRTRWFSITIHAADPDTGTGGVRPKEKKKPFASFWEGKLPMINGFAALGSNVYSFGGLTYPICLSNVYKLDVTTPHPRRVCPMISPRYNSHSLVVDGKIYVFSGHLRSILPTDCRDEVCWGEVFNPDNKRWEALPDPPYDSRVTTLAAALENPNRILVGFDVPGKRKTAMFCTYNVQNRSWEFLEPAERKIHPNYPVGSLQKTVTVDNTLYWVARKANEIILIAYNLDLDMWLEGRLQGLGILLFEDDHELSIQFPFLFHLEKQRFCLLQTSSHLTPDGHFQSVADLHCVAVDISHMPDGKNRLDISLAWEQIYKVDGPGGLSDCLLM
jgi:hypothetical protein